MRGVYTTARCVGIACGRLARAGGWWLTRRCGNVGANVAPRLPPGERQGATRMPNWKRTPVYGYCETCRVDIRIERNGRAARHSYGFRYVERVGPGTAHPNWRTVICPGSGVRIVASSAGERLDGAAFP